MSQCPYRIKDALDIGWFNCQFNEGHEGQDHQTQRSARQVEGIWHRPGEKSTADPEPYVPSVPSVFVTTRPPKVLKEATSNSSEVRSTK